MNTLFSFRRCPYAMRARMALRYASVPVEIVEVSLKNKPAQMLALSPKGTVPVLNADGVVIDESLQIMRWALAQNDPDDWLFKNDPGADVIMDMLIETNDQRFKTSLNHYKYAERYPEQPMEVYRMQCEMIAHYLDLTLADHDYLLGDRLSLADIALLPFVRQFAHVDREWFAQTPYVRLQAWLQRLLESELFISIMKK
jgi:glutathione S-transferase